MKTLNHTHPIKSAGFTLVELMVTIAVVAIVITIGVPNFQAFVKNGRLVSQINQTISMVSFARSEAAKRPNTSITVCTTSDQASCSGSSNWESGWLIMADVDGDRTLDTADGDQILLVSQPLEGNTTLRSSGFTSASYIQFDATGMPESNGTFTLCDDRGSSYAKAVALSIAGQSRMAVDEDADGIVNNHSGSGNNVTCP